MGVKYMQKWEEKVLDREEGRAEGKAELQKYILFETKLSRFRELQRKQQSFWYLSQNILKK